MVRFGAEPGERGSTDIRTTSTRATEVYFVPKDPPAPGSEPAARLAAGGVRVLEASPSTGDLSIYPTETRPWRSEFLGPKYSRIEKIVLTGVVDPEYFDARDALEDLPSGFTKHVEYGLGLAKEHDWFIGTIEERTPCTEIRFVEGKQPPAVQGSSFTVGLRWFADLTTELRRIKSRGENASLRVRRSHGHNALAKHLGLEAVPYAFGRHTDSRFIASVALNREEVTEDVADMLADAVAATAAEAARVAPARMVALQRDVEFANLDQLINVYRTALDRNHPEPWWQQFFEENVFVLQLLFGGPTVFVDAQVPIGEGDNLPKGKKIADYLFANSMTANASLVEIKKPSTLLLKKRPYREGVYGVQSEIGEAVAQVLDQALQLTRHEAATRSRTGAAQWTSNAPRCFVLAGRADELNTEDKKKSFDLYREHLAGVRIVTYDEILEQMENLRDFLAGGPFV